MPCGRQSLDKIDFAHIQGRPLSKKHIIRCLWQWFKLSRMLKVNKRKFFSHRTRRSSCTQEKSITCYITYARNFFLQTRWMKHVQFSSIYTLPSYPFYVYDQFNTQYTGATSRRYIEIFWKCLTERRILMETRYIPRKDLLLRGREVYTNWNSVRALRECSGMSVIAKKKTFFIFLTVIITWSISIGSHE